MSESKLFNINLFERNILISQIHGLERAQVYSSIPAFIFQNRGWVIKGINEVSKILLDLGEKDAFVIGQNTMSSSFLTVTVKNPEQVTIIIPEAIQSSLSKRSPSSNKLLTLPLPSSDDESDNNGKSNPTILCFDRAYRVLRTYLIYITETFILSTKQRNTC
jgi:hypothetical protein